MDLFKNLIVIMSLLTATACSNIHSANVGTFEDANGMSFSGQIVSIEQTKLNADFSERLTGAAIGHFIAAGLGANSSLKFVSAMFGVTIANKEHGNVFDLVEVQSTDGQRYKTNVPRDYFSLNENVVFTANDAVIDSIARI
ncbi:MAG: hypothetical protein ACJAZP_004146 [Psychromonas sp.]|jgi:hypothetical protein|uniref:hypothetical protein n=1 Tax=Psychromonas sp. TaxID=1884585 RepID=UPI0039E678D1